MKSLRMNSIRTYWEVTFHIVRYKNKPQPRMNANKGASFFCGRGLQPRCRCAGRQHANLTKNCHPPGWPYADSWPFTLSKRTSSQPSEIIEGCFGRGGLYVLSILNHWAILFMNHFMIFFSVQYVLTLLKWKRCYYKFALILKIGPDAGWYLLTISLPAKK